MKTVITSALIALPLMAMAQNKVIDNPVYGSKSVFTAGINIERVEVMKDTTKLWLSSNLPHEGQWAQISSESYIVANGQRLPLLKADGIKLNEPYYAPSKEDHVRHFSLSFPEVGKDVESIDFIEGDCPRCFKFWDIAISDKETAKLNAVKEERAKALAEGKATKDDGQPLCEAKLMLGKSSFKFRIIGYNKDVFGDADIQALCYINDPITGNQKSYYASLSENGSFELELPLVLENQTIGLQVRPIINTTFVARCNGSEEYVIDLNTMSETPIMDGYFKGDNADINNVLAQGYAVRIEMADVVKFNGNSVADYKAHIYSLGKENEAIIDAMNIPAKAKEYLKIENRGKMSYFLMMGGYFMEQAYRQSNNIPDNAKLENYERPVLDTEYYKFTQDLNLNNMEMFYSNEYYNVARNLMFFSEQEPVTALTILQILKEEGNLDAAGEKVMEIIQSSNARNIDVTEEDIQNTIAPCMDKLEKNGEIERIINAIHHAKLEEVLGVKNGILFDLIETAKICSVFENNTPVNAEQIAKLEKLDNTVLADYVKMRNAEIIAAIEAEKSRGGYSIHQSNETEADSLLVDLVKDHVGKVVFIDIWATWCGPCRLGIEKMKPYEPELEAKGVEFVYVTDESSPEKAWNNMIVGMKGSHYRLQSTVLNKLKEKFHLSGVPAYLYINKKGEVVYTETGFGGTDNIISKLNELLAE